MRYLYTFICLLVFGGIACAATIVELNVIPSSRAPLGAAQNWVRALSNLKSVRVLSTNVRSAKPKMTRSRDMVRVTAVIGSDNELLLPGRSFTLRQLPVIQDWIELQRSGKSIIEAKDRFGLSTAQLQKVHDSLKAIIRSSTKEKDASGVIHSIAAKIDYPIRFSHGARISLTDTRVRSELEGFTSGTALAMVLRSKELVFVPKVSPGGTINLMVVQEGDVAEAWPVGWESKQKKQELVPKVFDRLEIEITNTPITQVLSAVEARIETPVFYDDGLFEVMKLDPDNTIVSIPAGRTSYFRLIRQAVFKAKLKSELRVDERGKPFFWVTPTIRRSLTNRN